ncbi:MAG: CoA transferase [Chloroflexi bacterium]|nr:CoA transferase [Chloroflexota bacterium]
MTLDRDDFNAISHAAGITPSQSDIQFVGDGDPIYPSPLRLASGVSTLLGNIAGVVDDIRHKQTGQRQTAQIHMGQAAVGISSMWVLKVNGVNALESMPDSLAPGQGIFPTRDGRYLYLLGGFPHIVERTFEVLGCTYGNVTEHVASRDSADLEAKLIDAQLPGVVVKSPEEWLAHPQGKLLADSPAVIIERIGDAPAKPIPGGDLPLNGVRVIDNTKVLAGPTISRTLAALGADALHIGAPGVADMQAAQADTGHGKRRAHVDFDTDEGKDTIWNLIDEADIFSQSYRARSLARRGLSPEALAERRPGIIYISENAYGQFGPWQEKRGFDGNVQAATGIHHVQQKDLTNMMGTGPAIALNDYGTGYWGAYGALEALRRRSIEGGSWHVKVALGQTAAWFLRLGTPHSIEDADPDEGYRLADKYSEDVDSDYGTLTRLSFPIHFSDITPKWGRTVKPGSHEAVWQ